MILISRKYDKKTQRFSRDEGTAQAKRREENNNNDDHDYDNNKNAENKIREEERSEA